MSSLILTRARLRRTAPLATLARVLVPDDPSVRTETAHRLVWSLFAGNPESRRDFLWRQTRDGTFLILSPRPPEDPHALFDLEPKEFAPVLPIGRRLRFSLRANPIVAIAREKGQRGQRHDVVMHALRNIAKNERAELRSALIVRAGHEWLAKQGVRHGFTIGDDVHVDGYEQIRIPRESGKSIQFSVLDLEGVLTVNHPDRFIAAIAHGFGHARAFGCGLMLIAPAR